MQFVRTLQQIRRGEENLVGERAVDLAVLKEKEFAIPLSFVVTNESFEQFVIHNKLQGKIADALLSKEEKRVYEHVRELLLNGEFPNEMVSEIVEAYESLGVDANASLNDMVNAGEAPFVTVMLSPNHTLPSESWEGIILNVRGLEELLLAIKECWACLFTPSMQRHREEGGIGNKNLNVGAIIQHMPRGDVSAEAWSATGSNTEQLVVRSYYGTLDLAGDAEKDEFQLAREYLKPTYQSVGIQTTMLARDEEGRLGKVPIGPRGEEQKINDKVMIELGRLAKKASLTLDKQVKLCFNVDDETVTTLLCTRLLLTKGSVKLQSYQAEEVIEEVPEAEPEMSRTLIEREEAVVDVDEETGESEVVRQANHTTVVVKEGEQEPISEIPPVPEEAEETQETEPDQEAEPQETEPESDAEDLPEAEPFETSETGEQPTPEESEEPDEESEREEADEPAGIEEPESEETDEPGIEEPENEEPREEPEEITASPTEQPEPEPEDSIFAGVEEPEEHVAEETTIEHEPGETVIEREESVVAVEDGDEEIISNDQEGFVVEGEVSFEELYEQVKEALTQRYEARFKNQPPASMKDLFFELSNEVIIPHEGVIGKMVRAFEEDGDDQELEEEVRAIIDEFFDEIR